MPKNYRLLTSDECLFVMSECRRSGMTKSPLGARITPAYVMECSRYLHINGHDGRSPVTALIQRILDDIEDATAPLTPLVVSRKRTCYELTGTTYRTDANMDSLTLPKLFHLIRRATTRHEFIVNLLDGRAVTDHPSPTCDGCRAMDDLRRLVEDWNGK